MFEKLLVIPDTFFTADRKRLSLLAYLFLVMLCFGFFSPGLATLPPTDRDESSFAQASKQMIETGNYTDIRLQKEPRYKKPIGIYWLQSTSVRLLNPHNLSQIWAYRIPSFVGAIAAVLMTAALGTLLFTPAVGLLAAIMLAGCVLVNVEARIATTDAALLGCIMVAMYALARAYKGQATGWTIPFAFWTAIACGVLIKGPLILLPVLSALLWLKVSSKTIQWFRTLRPALGLPYALALIAPWFVAITLQSHGAFMQQSAGNDMMAKLWQGQNRGMLPPGLHLLLLPIVFFPFSIFVLFASPDIWKNRKDEAVKFCLGWAVPTWIVFEASMTKLPHYVMPAYPAIALLTAKFLIDGFPSVTNATRRFSIVMIVAVWLIIGVGFAAAFSLLPILSDNAWRVPQIVAGIILIMSQAFALFFFPRQKTASLFILTAGSLVFLSTVFGYTLPSLQHIWMSREIVEAAAPLKPCLESQIVSVGYHEPSLAFLGGTETAMLANGQEAADALRKNACDVVALTNDHEAEFLKAFAGDPRQPVASGTIDGLNAGHGAKAAMTLFVAPVVPQ